MRKRAVRFGSPRSTVPRTDGSGDLGGVTSHFSIPGGNE